MKHGCFLEKNMNYYVMLSTVILCDAFDCGGGLSFAAANLDHQYP